MRRGWTPRNAVVVPQGMGLRVLSSLPLVRVPATCRCDHSRGKQNFCNGLMNPLFSDLESNSQLAKIRGWIISILAGVH